MSLSLTHLTNEEIERLAYISNDPLVASLYARIIELERMVESLNDSIDNDSLTAWSNLKGPVDEYKEFFNDCFAHLSGHYPGPSVTCDYDKSVIFDAIKRGDAK